MNDKEIALELVKLILPQALNGIKTNSYPEEIAKLYNKILKELKANPSTPNEDQKQMHKVVK